jgi:cell wall-associated NlpC family hydrolase
MTGADVVATARTHLGARWMHQARLPRVAMDCDGLVILVARELGLVAPDFDVQGYSRYPNGSMEGLCDTYMQRLPPVQPQALELGAVLLLQPFDQPQHMGIVGDYRHGGPSLIHACAIRGKVIESRFMVARNMRLVAAYRLPGVA